MRRVLLFAIFVAVTGCAGGGDDAARPLRFWQFWDTGVIEPIVRRFEAENPGIKVEVEQLTWKSGLEKIQAAVASGTEPDLCELGSTWLPRFSYEGVLADLTGVYEAVADTAEPPFEHERLTAQFGADSRVYVPQKIG